MDPPGAALSARRRRPRGGRRVLKQSTRPRREMGPAWQWHERGRTARRETPRTQARTSVTSQKRKKETRKWAAVGEFVYWAESEVRARLG
jgi:hypothetical protein